MISTGFSKLDELTGGLIPGKLFLIIGHRGVGKSSFAYTIARSVLKQTTVHVWGECDLFSMRPPKGCRFYWRERCHVEALDALYRQVLPRPGLLVVDDVDHLACSRKPILFNPNIYTGTRLKRLAEDLNIPILLTSWLPCLLGSENNPAMQIDSIRISPYRRPGCAPAADTVVLLYRPSFDGGPEYPVELHIDKTPSGFTRQKIEFSFSTYKEIG